MRVIRIERPEWFADALCRGGGNEPFFPSRGVSAQAAREMCARCPAVMACLEYALADPSLEGVWGGHTANERDRIRQRRSNAS